MKKTKIIILTILILFSLASCKKNEKDNNNKVEDKQEIIEPTVKQDEPIVGGYMDAQDKTITAELQKIFDEAFNSLSAKAYNKENLAFSTYEPIELVATQLVSGTNYKFLANGTKTNPMAKGTYYVYINVDLNGNVGLLDIETINEKQVDVTQMSFWIVFYDQFGNELQRTSEKYGSIPLYDEKQYGHIDVWTYKNTGETVNEFKPITTNTYFVGYQYGYVNTEVNFDDYGSVKGGGRYILNDKVLITAVPNKTYQFVKWSDGNTDNPRSVIAGDGNIYMAVFTRPDGLYNGDSFISWQELKEDPDLYSSISLNTSGGYSIKGSSGKIISLEGELVLGEEDNVEIKNAFNGGKITSLTLKGSSKFSVQNFTDTCFSDSAIEKIYIETLGQDDLANQIHCRHLNSMPSSTELFIDKRNPYIIEKDNVLYSADMKTIYHVKTRNLETFTIPDGVETISAHFFSFDETITKIVLPDSIKTINDFAFEFCSNLKEVEYMGDVYTNYTELKSKFDESDVSVEKIAFTMTGLDNAPPPICVSGETLITLADGSKVMIKDMKGNEDVLTYNLDTGIFEGKEMLGLYHHDTGTYRIISLKFDNGETLELIGNHHLLNVSRHEYSKISNDNYEDYIGDEFMLSDGSSAKLIEGEIIRKYTGVYSIISKKNENFIINDFVSLSGIPSDVNIQRYEIGEDMKYDQQKKQADIERYGLFTYEQWKDYVNEEEFDGINAAEYKILIEKGMITYEDIFLFVKTIQRDKVIPN